MIAWPRDHAVTPTLVLRDAEVAGRRVDVVVEGETIAAVVDAHSAGDGEHTIACAGGALLPGLHDHHLHLLARAAAATSHTVAHDLDAVLRAAHAHTPPGEALRAVGYDEAVSGPLDRWRLDALAPGRVVRVQHRSGAMWVLGSAALRAVGLDSTDVALAADLPEGAVEYDSAGQPTGRLFRLDEWLGARLTPSDAPDLAAVGRRLVALGITGVTDCTPTNTPGAFDVLADAARNGALPVTVMATGGIAMAAVAMPEPLQRGPVKVVLADHRLPALTDVVRAFAVAHGAGRAVAVHCVTRAALVLALAAFEEAGAMAGDRVEHAAVVPVELVAHLAQLGLRVVTQPALVVERGDAYLDEVDAVDQPDLYRCASLQEAGIPVGGSTDAPFGPDDPWLAMQAAVARRSRRGRRVGDDRGLTPGAALALFLSPLDDPGGPPRRVRPGEAADLCLLDAPLMVALQQLRADRVAVTVRSGRLTYEA